MHDEDAVAVDDGVETVRDGEDRAVREVAAQNLPSKPTEPVGLCAVEKSAPLCRTGLRHQSFT
jgi:hypothetical protein